MSRAYRASRYHVFLSLCLLFMLAGAVTHSAAAAPINDDEFWTRLQQTATLFDQALADAAPPRPALTQIQALWQNVDAVQFANGDVVAVDLNWLTQGLSGKSADELGTLRREVQGLLKYHAAHPHDTPQGLQSALAALDEVLQDARFHYIPTPTPQITPQPDQSGPDIQLISPELAQALLLIAGIIVVGALLLNFARNLRVQQRQLPELLPEDEPTTSQAARERAVDSQEAQDYRSAMRYLYLASLLLLDERGVLHYDRALTNREHLRQVAAQPELSAALRPVVNTFDRVWYGFAPVDEPMFDAFRQDVERLRHITP